MSPPARTSILRAVPASPIAGTRHRPLPMTCLDLASRMIDLRGHGLLPAGSLGSGFRELLAEACNDGTSN